MDAFNNKLLVGKNGLLHPQRIEGIITAVRVVSHGQGHVLWDCPSDYNFFEVLKRYNPDTCTFFTPVGEMGFALHEMFKVSGLSIGDLPYKQYISSIEELHLLKRDASQVYETD